MLGIGSDPMAVRVRAGTDPAKSQITYRQLLTLTSGLTAGERGAALRSPAWEEIVASERLAE